MTKTMNSIINRTKLIDQPIIEMILSQRYSKSGIKFQKSYTEDYSFTYLVNGFKRSVNIVRNSVKYTNSPNFSISLNLNKLNIFNGTSFIFVDETANSLYIVDGLDLLSYIVAHPNNIQSSKDSTNKSWCIVPKKDIQSLISDNPNSLIKYNKQIAKLFELNRDESNYQNLI